MQSQAAAAALVIGSIIDVCKHYKRNDRITVPLLKSLDVILSDGSLVSLYEKSGYVILHEIYTMNNCVFIC